MLSVQIPWYADIVNYLACRVMPFEFSYQQGRKLRTGCRLYIWDDPLLYRRGAYMIIRRCVQKQNRVVLWKNVMHHHMEDTLQETRQPRKFFNRDIISLLYSKTVLNG